MAYTLLVLLSVSVDMAFLEVFMGVCRRRHGELKKFVI